MSMQQTSILAFHSLDPNKLNERQQQVLEALEEIQPATNRMIAQKSRIPINVVTPRIGELRKKGKVEADHTGIDATGRSAIYWKVTS